MIRRSLLTYLTCSLVFLASCGDGGSSSSKKAARPTGPLDWKAASKLNNDACALMDQQKIADALDLFREMTERSPNLAVGWFNLGIALLNVQRNDPQDRDRTHAECERVLRHAMTIDAKDPHGPYTLGILLRYQGRMDEAFEQFEAACKLDPNDADANYAYGQALATKRRYAEALVHLRISLHHQSHIQSSWYAISGVLARLGKDEERAEALTNFELFENNPNPKIGKKLEEKYNFMGRYACVIRSIPRFGDAPPLAKGTPPTFVAAEFEGARWRGSVVAPPKSLVAGSGIQDFLVNRVVPAFAGGLVAADFDGDGRREIYVGDGTGIGRLYRDDGFFWNDVTSASGLSGEVRSIGGVTGDIDHDGDLDLVVFGAGPLVLALNDGKGHFTTSTLGDGSSIVLQAAILDADHDGDLDILAPGWLALPARDVLAAKDMEFPRDFAGAPNRLFNNNRPTIFEPGAAKPAETFTEIGERTSLRGGAERTAGYVILDADRDGDRDLYELNDGAPNRLMMNDRIWRYHDEAKSRGVDDAGPAFRGLASDLDQDGFEDIAFVRGPEWATSFLYWRPATGLYEVKTIVELGVRDLSFSGIVAPADFDNDGRVDFVVSSTDAAMVTPVARDEEGYSRGKDVAIGDGEARVAAMCALDWDRDGKLDVLLTSTDGSVRLLRNETQSKNRWISIALRGKEGFDPSETWANTFGIGTSIEVAVDEVKVYVDTASVSGSGASTDEPVHVGLGEHDATDYIRMIWPDLVIQSEVALVAGRTHEIKEENRKPSSCPVLFKYSGEGDRFDFVTDFLGVGGLGFFVAPDAYAPPDETEVVRIGDLPAKDGRLLLRVAEPMEEICYIDELKFIAVDHDADVEVFADERLSTTEAMPTGRPIGFTERIRPTRVTTRNGLDTTAETTKADRVYQQDMHRDRRFIGYLSEEQHLACNFDSSRIAAARAKAGDDARLWLFVDGWVEYPYSHVNFALWQAGIRSESFSIDVGRGDGTFREGLKEVGYPGGMSRTMVVDVTSLFDATTSSLRLRTNLEIYVDDLWLAVDVPAERLTITEVAFDVAELRFLGYPREVSPDGKMPKPYDYQSIDATFEWKTMGGAYTPYGDVRSLLERPEDSYVILNHGDEIALEVEEKRLPPLSPGRRRTTFLKADGWCKDMDPYTATPDTVAPLPFHGMSAYPMPEGAAVPQDATRHVPPYFPARSR